MDEYHASALADFFVEVLEGRARQIKADPEVPDFKDHQRIGQKLVDLLKSTIESQCADPDPEMFAKALFEIDDDPEMLAWIENWMDDDEIKRKVMDILRDKIMAVTES